jgi:hypothetical protein
VTAFSETDLAKLAIDESHIAKGSAYAAQAQALAFRALQAAHNEVFQAQLEQQARAQQAAAQAQAQARAAAVAGLATTTEPGQPSPTNNPNLASSPPHPPLGRAPLTRSIYSLSAIHSQSRYSIVDHSRRVLHRHNHLQPPYRMDSWPMARKHPSNRLCPCSSLALSNKSR